VTIDRDQAGGDQEINILNRRSDSDISYFVRDVLETAENPNIPVILNCPNGDINRSTIAGLAQYNLPPSPTVDHFESESESEDPCFLTGTLIKILTGFIEIEKIKAGMKVLGWHEKTQKIVNCRVKKLLIHDKKERVEEYFLLKTENSEAKVTLNHPFFVGNDYKQIQKIEDFVYIYSEGISQERIVSKELIKCEPTITYNLELNKLSPQNYFANNYLVHNMKFYEG
jgi:hypothetical protein